jgi:hypothetical protein
MADMERRRDRLARSAAMVALGQVWAWELTLLASGLAAMQLAQKASSMVARLASSLRVPIPISQA